MGVQWSRLLNILDTLRVLHQHIALSNLVTSSADAQPRLTTPSALFATTYAIERDAIRHQRVDLAIRFLHQVRHFPTLLLRQANLIHDSFSGRLLGQNWFLRAHLQVFILLDLLDHFWFRQRTSLAFVRENHWLFCIVSSAYQAGEICHCQGQIFLMIVEKVRLNGLIMILPRSPVGQWDDSLGFRWFLLHFWFFIGSFDVAQQIL